MLLCVVFVLLGEYLGYYSSVLAVLGFFVFDLQVLLFFQVQWFFAPPPASSVARLLWRGLAVVEVLAGWAHPLWVCLAGSAHPRDGAESRRGSVVGGRPSVAGPRGREIVPSTCRWEAVDRRTRVIAGLHPGVADLHPGVAARRRALGDPPPLGVHVLAGALRPLLRVRLVFLFFFVVLFIFVVYFIYQVLSWY